MKIHLLIVTTVIIAGCYSSTPQKTGLEGKELPSFNLSLYNNSNHINTKDIPAGKPFVLFYYSPHCPYCKWQINEIVSDIEKLKEIQFYFITNFPNKEVKQLYEKYNLNKYTNIFSVKDSANIVADYFEVPGIPYLAIYGKDKKLNEVFMGKTYSSQILKIAQN